MTAGIDRTSHAETRRLHRAMRSPLPSESDADRDVDHVDDLRDLWDDLVADSAVVEPPGPPLSAPLAPLPSRTEPVVDLSSLPAVPSHVLGANDLIVLPADARVAAPVAPLVVAPAGDAPPEVDRGDERQIEADPEPDAPTRRERRAIKRLAKDEARGARLELRRHRILPRTVIGISALLLAAAVGAAFSGALLYAYYDWRLSSNEDRVGVLAESLQQRLTDAGASIDEAQQQALAELQDRAGPLIDQKSDAVAMADLTPVVLPSTFFLSTLDEDGRPSVGTAFVVASDDTQTLLLTSYRAVSASTTSPGPEIHLSNNSGEAQVAQLYSWDPEHDLALLTLDQGGLEPLSWASGDDAAVTGKPVYAASGEGTAGVTFSPGTVLDQSADGIQMTAPVGSAWQGGPVVNQDGKVVAVASLAYQPLGFNPGQVPFAPPVDAACERLLDCGADAPAAGNAG